MTFSGKGEGVKEEVQRRVDGGRDLMDNPRKTGDQAMA
jgi:hypothetical protein